LLSCVERFFYGAPPLCFFVAHAYIQEYIKFQRLACRAFLILRQHAAIVVNMFDLVSQDLFDSTGTRSAAPRLLERFQLNLSDDDAVLHMQQVVAALSGVQRMTVSI
jgi:hypothetical protein